jgi:hypothetical protein
VNIVTSALFIDVTRRFEDILDRSGAPLVIECDKAALFKGLFRHVQLRKTAALTSLNPLACRFVRCRFRCRGLRQSPAGSRGERSARSPCNAAVVALGSRVLLCLCVVRHGTGSALEQP